MWVRRFVSCVVALGALCATATPVTAGPTGGALPPELVANLVVAGLHGIPDDAAMVAVNITATRAAGRGFFTAFPCDGDLPDASNVNYLADQNVPNLALVRIADDGTICIATSAIADLVVDVIGYVPDGSAISPLPRPVRTVDTRRTGTLRAGETLRIPITSLDGVEPTADLVMANVTGIARGGTGFLTTHPCLDPVPDTSSVNFGPGETNANFVTSRIGPTGEVCITTSEPADVVVDVAATASAGIDTLAVPVRIVDTRRTAPIAAGSTLTLDVTGRDDVPDDAGAAVYNLTATNATGKGFATSHPCLSQPPDASNLNYVPGPPRANGTITKLSSTGHLCVTTSQTVNLIVDLIGYTTDSRHYVPVTPVRIEDSRTGWAPECEQYIAGVYPNGQAGRLALVDRRSGARTFVPGLEVDKVPQRHLLDGDCRHILFFSWKQLRRVDPVTGIQETMITGRELWQPMFLVDGTAAAWSYGDLATTMIDPAPHLELIDLRTGAWILRIEPWSKYYSDKVQVDEELRLLGRPRHPGYEVWDLESGDLVFRTDQHGQAWELSPRGTYVARSYAHGDRSYCEVMTVFGDVVETFSTGATSYGASLPCRWASEGVLFAYGSDWDTTYRHQLFGETTILVESSRDPNAAPSFNPRAGWVATIPWDYR